MQVSEHGGSLSPCSVKDKRIEWITSTREELKPYASLTLRPSETRHVTFHLPIKQLAFYNIDLELVLEPGTVQMMLGSSSEDIRLRGELKIVGGSKMVVDQRVFICPVTMS